VKLDRKIDARKSLALAAVLTLLALATGCGGFNGSYSASPASFFLPGLLKADPVKEQSPSVLTNDIPTKSVEILAKVQ
jgi:hypothetical protein